MQERNLILFENELLIQEIIATLESINVLMSGVNPYPRSGGIPLFT